MSEVAFVTEPETDAFVKVGILFTSGAREDLALPGKVAIRMVEDFYGRDIRAANNLHSYVGGGIATVMDFNAVSQVILIDSTRDRRFSKLLLSLSE